MWLSVPLRHFCAVPGCLDSTKPLKKAVFVAGKYYKIMNLLQLSKICTKFDINLGAFLNRFFPGKIVPGGVQNILRPKIFLIFPEKI